MGVQSINQFAVKVIRVSERQPFPGDGNDNQPGRLTSMSSTFFDQAKHLLLQARASYNLNKLKFTHKLIFYTPTQPPTAGGHFTQPQNSILPIWRLDIPGRICLPCPCKGFSQSGWLFRPGRSFAPSAVGARRHFRQIPDGCSKGPVLAVLISFQSTLHWFQYFF